MPDPGSPGCRNRERSLRHYLSTWNLTRDGELLTTPRGLLLPVRRGGVPLMLKIATHEEERAGAALMVWWGNDGAARVLAHDDAALLIERADEGPSLLPPCHTDDEAIEIMCSVTGRLHRPRRGPRPDLAPLSRWFRDLLCERTAKTPVLALAAETAHRLLSVSSETTVLHGDIHPGNILHFARHGWLAVDPKGLIGHRAFDYANMFCCPDYETAADRDRFRKRLGIVSRAAGLEGPVLLRWILAWAGLSATWVIESGLSPKTQLAVAELAAAELL